MDKKTAYKVISQFRANNCKSGALAIALDEALKALKPIAVNQVFCIKLEILDSGNYYHSKAAQSTLWLEASNNKKKMQAHIAEWRSKVVERCKDNNSSFEFDFHHGSPYNFTANKSNCNELPFYFKGKHYCFTILEVSKSIKSMYDDRIEKRYGCRSRYDVLFKFIEHEVIRGRLHRQRGAAKEWSKDYSRGGSGFSWWLCRVGSS